MAYVMQEQLSQLRQQQQQGQAPQAPQQPQQPRTRGGEGSGTTQIFAVASPQLESGTDQVYAISDGIRNIGLIRRMILQSDDNGETEDEDADRSHNALLGAYTSWRRHPQDERAHSSGPASEPSASTWFTPILAHIAPSPDRRGYQATSEPYDAHTPESRSVMLALRRRLDNLEAIFSTPDDVVFDQAEGMSQPHTQGTLQNAEVAAKATELQAHVRFFQDLLKDTFGEFAMHNDSCKVNAQRVMKLKTLLDTLSGPYDSLHPAFASFCESTLANVQKMVDEVEADNNLCVQRRSAAWRRYREARDACSVVQTVQQDAICALCFNNLVDCALNCGHTMCMRCAISVGSCPNCRVPISNRLKIFLYT